MFKMELQYLPTATALVQYVRGGGDVPLAHGAQLCQPQGVAVLAPAHWLPADVHPKQQQQIVTWIK